MKHTVPGLSRNAINRWGAALVEALRQGDAHARSAADGSGLSSVSLPASRLGRQCLTTCHQLYGWARISS